VRTPEPYQRDHLSRIFARAAHKLQVHQVRKVIKYLDFYFMNFKNFKLYKLRAAHARYLILGPVSRLYAFSAYRNQT